MEADVDTGVAVSAVFDEALREATVTPTTFTLRREQESVPGAVSLAAEVTAVFTPDQPLALLTAYTATVTTQIESLTGGALGADYGWIFTTRDGSWGTAAIMEKEDPGYAQGPYIAVDPEGTAFALWEESDSMVSPIWASRYTQAGGWEPPEIISGSSGRNPQVAADANGNAVAVWTQGDGLRNDVWANRYTRIGGWGIAELIETGAGDAGTPQVVIDPDGNAQAVWEQSDGMRFRIWANGYTLGSGWGAAEPIDESNMASARWVRVGMDPDGDALAVWSHSDGMRSNIWANRYTPSGGWSMPERIESNNAGSAVVPQVALDSSGNALAVWAQDEGSGYNIWSNRYAPGDGWDVAVRVHANDAGPSNSPALDMNPRGDAMAVWIQDEGGGSNRLWWSGYTPNDGWAEAEGVGTGDVSILSFYPHVAIDSSGNALTLWVQGDQGYELWSSRYTPAEGWGFGERLDTLRSNAVAPQLAVDPSGRAMTIWTQSATPFLNLSWNRFE
jgi:hypothetical protein